MSDRRLYRLAASVFLVLCGMHTMAALTLAVFNESGTAWRCGVAAVCSAIAALVLDAEVSQ